jgi:hypothetical protein
VKQAAGQQGKGEQLTPQTSNLEPEKWSLTIEGDQLKFARTRKQWIVESE